MVKNFYLKGLKCSHKGHNIIAYRIVLCFLLSALCSLLLPAATITFRNETVMCRGTSVTLGDIATITPDRDDDVANIELLKSIVLFPAPIAGKDRTITYREVYDYLNMRGVRVGLHTFAGASQVTVTAKQQTPSKQTTPSAPQSSATGTSAVFVRRDATPGNSGNEDLSDAEDAVHHAVLTFLKDSVDANAPWRVDVGMTSEGQRQLAVAGEIIGIRAVIDEHPSRQSTSQYDPAEQWLGRQRFELQCRNIRPETGMHHTLLVDVNVSLPKAVVVTRHAVPKGKILSAADVRLSYLAEDQTPVNVTKSRTVNGVTTQRGRDPEIDPDVATRIDDVIGKAVVRGLQNNATVLFSQLEKPLLVKRSEAVTLYLRNGGITIKMTARAKEDGRAGDLVTVESLTDKQQTNLARVVDYGTVEVEKR
ncbi:MAG: flagellar basal body P-ring formation chaperone FlgA [Planctomycetaceae bacterium]|nr:flagellar basal body P-ring formation chaperone FlgA [Planctomycetaceae bacterium]